MPCKPAGGLAQEPRAAPGATPVTDLAGETAQLSGYSVAAEVASRLDIAGGLPFRSWHVLAVQHVHSSIAPLVDALCLGGATAASITVLGKSYSTRAEAVAELTARGVRFIDPGRMRDPLRSFEEELGARAAAALDELDSVATRLLVLDEGAVAAKALATRVSLAQRCRLVEQTTRGARWIDSAAVPFPAVDVARSAAKASLEGPLVAEAMMTGIQLALGELHAAPARAGVVGYGRMGSRLAALLAARLPVVVHDGDEQQAQEARHDGFAVTDMATLLRTVDMVVGCTGTGILGDAELAAVDRPLILVNGASSDIEFSLWPRRAGPMILPGSAGDENRPWLNHYLAGPRGSHILITGGFPANFHHRVAPIPAHLFQVTRALMVAGAVQVIQGPPRAGLTPLEAGIQHVVATAAASVHPTVAAVRRDTDG